MKTASRACCCLVAAFFVVSMVVWMNRIARKLKKEIEARVEKLADRPERAAGWGLFLFVFLMVVREGAELALILRAVEFSAQGVNVWIGTLLGLGSPSPSDLFFFKGTLRIPLGRFFAATSVILMIVAFQLALTGIHELSEAQWLASSQREMAIVGPIVRNDVFFFVVILGAVAILVVREWMKLQVTRIAVTKGAPQVLRYRKSRRGSSSRGMGSPQAGTLDVRRGGRKRFGDCRAGDGFRLRSRTAAAPAPAQDFYSRKMILCAFRWRRSMTTICISYQVRDGSSAKFASCDSQTWRRVGSGAGRVPNLRRRRDIVRMDRT